MSSMKELLLLRIDRGVEALEEGCPVSVPALLVSYLGAGHAGDDFFLLGGDNFDETEGERDRGLLALK